MAKFTGAKYSDSSGFSFTFYDDIGSAIYPSEINAITAEKLSVSKLCILDCNKYLYSCATKQTENYIFRNTFCLTFSSFELKPELNF